MNGSIYPGSLSTSDLEDKWSSVGCEGKLQSLIVEMPAGIFE